MSHIMLSTSHPIRLPHQNLMTSYHSHHPINETSSHPIDKQLDRKKHCRESRRLEGWLRRTTQECPDTPATQRWLSTRSKILRMLHAGAQFWSEAVTVCSRPPCCKAHHSFCFELTSQKPFNALVTSSSLHASSIQSTNEPSLQIMHSHHPINQTSSHPIDNHLHGKASQ